MEKDLKKFIEKEILPNLIKNLYGVQFDIIWLEFLIQQKEGELNNLNQPIVLNPKQKPEKQIMEQASERAKLGNEIEALKKKKEEKEKVVEINQKFLVWLKDRIK